MDLTAFVYRLSAKLPAEEKSGLAAAMRRSATAVTQQLADADGHDDADAALKHYDTALAGLRELLTAGLIARRLKFFHRVQLGRLRRRIAGVEALVEADRQQCDDERETMHTLAKLGPKRAA
jgi:four helix bundle protein